MGSIEGWRIHTFDDFAFFFSVGPPLATFRGSKELEKVSEGVLGAFWGAPHFFFRPPRAPEEASECPRGLPTRVWSDFENVKKPLVFIAFSAMGRPLGRPGRPWGELLAVQGSSQRIKGTRSSYRRGSLGPLERCPLVSEGSLGGPRAPKWSLGAISGGSRELPEPSELLFSL